MTNPRTVPEVLRAAADLIEPEGRWTQRELARRANGRSTNPNSLEAVCWCSAGALQRIIGSTADPYHEAINWLREAIADVVTIFNDAPGRASHEVIAALRQAADLAEAAQQ